MESGSMCFNVQSFGAAGDGVTKCTSVLQQLIDHCYEDGGGRIWFPAGTYVTGTLYLKSWVTLELGSGAVLLASPDIRDYGIDTHYNRYRNEPELDRCFLYAEDETEITITGAGTIDGNAECFPNRDTIWRPMMVRFLRCSHIRVENIKLVNAAAWTTAFLDSEYIWTKGLFISNEKRYNGDGLDFDGCAHVFVSDCYLKGTDDNLCLQASSPDYPMTDVHISGCEFTSVCAGIRIGLKSVGNISNVVIANCTMHEVWREGIKIECTEGGRIEHLSINNIVMHNVTRPLFIILNNRFEPDGLGSSISLNHIPEIGKLRHIVVSQLMAVDDEEMAAVHRRFDNDMMGAPWFNGIRVDAETDHPIEDLSLSGVRYITIGGVKLTDIPGGYPVVVNKKWQDNSLKIVDKNQIKNQERGINPRNCGSENYYPDWSRAAFMDIRNVKGLWVSGGYFKTLQPDERPPVLIQNCLVYEEAWQVQE